MTNTSEQIIEHFAKFIFRELGIVYAPVNHYQLDARLKEAAKLAGLGSVEALYESTKSSVSPDLRLLLLDLATNNETLFFRDPAVFQAIEQIVLVEAARSASRRDPFKIWSAACSTGQEIYSLAMLLQQQARELPGGRYEVLATDVSDRVLKQAEAGVYSQLQVQRGLPAALLVKNFRQVQAGAAQGAWQVKDELKQGVTFKQLNLKDSFAALGPFDLILCRNVLIYQAPEGKKEIIARLHDRLATGGYLVLGAAESLLGISDEFEMVRTEKATIYRKKARLARAG